MHLLEALTRIIAEGYGLDLTLHPIPSYDDLNFHGKTEDGHEFAVKLMNPHLDSQLVDLQVAALAHLAHFSLPFDIPRVVPTKTGAPYQSVQITHEPRILWILHWCPGALMSSLPKHTLPLMEHFGQVVAQLNAALASFSHPAMKRGHSWELHQAATLLPLTHQIEGPCREIARNVLNRFKQHVLPLLESLPHSVIHNDVNDNNTLVQFDNGGQPYVSGLFDFGDMSHQATICELAIALAYALFHKDDPLAFCAAFLKGYTSVRPLTCDEIDLLFDLIKVRLAVSIAFSSHRQQLEPENTYIPISQASAKKTLEQLEAINPILATARFRFVCRMPVTDGVERIMAFLKSPTQKVQPVIEVDRWDVVLDLSATSPLLGSNPANRKLDRLSAKIREVMAAAKSDWAIGRYLENRLLYDSPLFGTDRSPTSERRTIHLGLDIFAGAGTPVFAPSDGKVIISAINNEPLDYGGLLILQHYVPEGPNYYTIFGHLSHQSIKAMPVGRWVTAGQQIATLGKPSENGGWPPHLHLQIGLDLLGMGTGFPGVCRQSEMAFWKALCPNPAYFLGMPEVDVFDAS